MSERSIFIIRHGERVVFSSWDGLFRALFRWTSSISNPPMVILIGWNRSKNRTGFLSETIFNHDLNLYFSNKYGSKLFPKRDDGKEMCTLDSPITENGYEKSMQKGRFNDFFWFESKDNFRSRNGRKWNRGWSRVYISISTVHTNCRWSVERIGSQRGNSVGWLLHFSFLKKI